MSLRDFLEIPYDKLEEMNLATKEARIKRVAAHKMREKHMKYLADEKRIKAVTVCFSDL
jgi:glutamine synthetase